MKTADQVYRLRIFLFSFARLSKCRLSLEALVEILADRDSDLSDFDEESDFYEPSDPEESSKEEMSDENVEDSPDECEREESKMAASWWVYKAPVGKGLRNDPKVQHNVIRWLASWHFYSIDCTPGKFRKVIIVSTLEKLESLHMPVLIICFLETNL